MKKIIFPFISLATIALFYSCSPESVVDALTTNITYTNDIKPIINANCISCHGNSPSAGASSLTTYASVKTATQTTDINGLIPRISLATGIPGAMPEGGQKLPQATIDKIVAWAAQGYKE